VGKPASSVRKRLNNFTITPVKLHIHLFLDAMPRRFPDFFRQLDRLIRNYERHKSFHPIPLLNIILIRTKFERYRIPVKVAKKTSKVKFENKKTVIREFPNHGVQDACLMAMLFFSFRR